MDELLYCKDCGKKRSQKSKGVYVDNCDCIMKSEKKDSYVVYLITIVFILTIISLFYSITDYFVVYPIHWSIMVIVFLIITETCFFREELKITRPTKGCRTFDCSIFDKLVSMVVGMFGTCWFLLVYNFSRRIIDVAMSNKETTLCIVGVVAFIMSNVLLRHWINKCYHKKNCQES